ncbi:MAG TPA: 1-(5-phosphoribosyl)-5-[(5-phosphoribosylamino)methylideneamino]imidazole-4-carboxamide isomerase [Flavobacteriales bacterium]|nr:1-(5-phosphoribosyl)-5-[(5-phosphoribosylamino)methylideneamino]imidazole-4-carboxamide isomerase [Flavobacteriales bacterium]HRE74026.1 1-(5-phosphoribosyl)-5-[(5-phosphoribosylamino)methylideneamino]imidazole-4-carboxamide isomerase [Flavobacteriales bacterium]HRE95886.1 1-(5-phosphoribosyl)-5-[(5-phosphoribosylamino)methylideneamino]imidazole-4-carboxamide isomerase [Flavobacteriales bacterium]HRJ35124.1 1-(5-phosphoribosyl)-5-[(5-phosphoribosylamino)methylideneamino]imidazole-4-carboxamid
MILIPAIDIIDGKCVRLTKGDYSTRKVYNEDPLEVAMQFQDAGLTHLHLVDLDGAKASHIVNWKVLEKIAARTKLHIDFGGGLKSDKDLQIAFNSGAEKITGGSIAVKSPDVFKQWIKDYGTERIILGADVKEEKISITGWTEDTDTYVCDFLNDYRSSSGIEYVICTDIAKDGMLEGPSMELYSKILSEIPSLKLIASGGVSSVSDLEQLKEKGLFAAIIGKAIYEGKISLGELAKMVSA